MKLPDVPIVSEELSFTPNTNGWASIGDTTRNYTPDASIWASGATSLVLNGLDFATLGFHDSGNNVQFIRCGGSNMTLGFDGGFGSANILHPGLSAFGGSAYSQQRVRVYATGDTSAHFPLAVVNTAGTATHFSVRGDGEVWSSQAITVSDRRRKRQIAPLDPAQGLAALRALQPSAYRLISETDDSGLLHYGLIAQEAQAVDANLIRTGENDTLGVDYTSVLAVLIAAVQTIDQRLTALEARL